MVLEKNNTSVIICLHIIICNTHRPYVYIIHVYIYVNSCLLVTVNVTVTIPTPFTRPLSQGGPIASYASVTIGLGRIFVPAITANLCGGGGLRRRVSPGH